MMGKYWCQVIQPVGNDFKADMEVDDDGEWATREYCEQLEKERDEWKRKCEELCQAHGIALIELHDAKKEAVETAKFLQQNIYEVYDGKAAHMNDVAYKKAQAIINKAEGKG